MQPLFSMVNLGGVHSEPPRRSHFNKILKTEKNKGAVSGYRNIGGKGNGKKERSRKF